ncbi:hypothetical protein C8R45DRAFT_1221143 [Mycena sanguinolenta]|nr:hypothetical protein C8R45DRAFT_1221143 [Mycena sanguinolenta]
MRHPQLSDEYALQARHVGLDARDISRPSVTTSRTSGLRRGCVQPVEYGMGLNSHSGVDHILARLRTAAGYAIIAVGAPTMPIAYSYSHRSDCRCTRMPHRRYQTPHQPPAPKSGSARAITEVIQALLVLLPLELRVRLDRHAFTPMPTLTSTSMAPSSSAIRSPSLAVLLQECPGQTASATSAGNPFPTLSILSSCSPLRRVRHAWHPAQSEGAVTALRAPPPQAVLPCGFAAAAARGGARAAASAVRAHGRTAPPRYLVLRAAHPRTTNADAGPPIPLEIDIPWRRAEPPAPARAACDWGACGSRGGRCSSHGFLECLTTARPPDAHPLLPKLTLHIRMAMGTSSTQNRSRCRPYARAREDDVLAPWRSRAQSSFLSPRRRLDYALAPEVVAEDCCRDKDGQACIGMMGRRRAKVHTQDRQPLHGYRPSDLANVQRF